MQKLERSFLMPKKQLAVVGQHQPPAGSDWRTRPEAAQYLRLAKSTLASWASRGRGPEFVRLGTAVRYSQTALDAYLASSTVRPTVASL